MKRINLPLFIGVIIVTLVILVCVFPEGFSKADPYGKQRVEIIRDKDNTTILTPPIAPCKEYPWGTDHLGRDLKSMIVYGSNLTIMLAVTIALGRLAIAVPTAISAAYGNRLINKIIKQYSIIFNAFPIIILVLMLSNIKLFADLWGNSWSAIAFFLIILGWTKTAKLLKQKVSEVISQDFIEGEISIGKSKLEIAVQNVLPHIIPTVIVMFFLEIAMALLIMAQIGIFNIIFAGGYYANKALGHLRVPMQFDWANLLSLANIYFGTSRMWLIMYPITAFAISIIGFNLLGEGLRIEFDKRDSRIISFIRRIPSWLSPARYLYELKNFTLYRKTVYIKTIVYLTVAVIALFPPPTSPYRFDCDYAFKHVVELSSFKYHGRLAGTDSNHKLAEYLKGKFIEYGVEPFEGSYLHEFNIIEQLNIRDAEITVACENGEISLINRNDIVVTSPISINAEYDMIYVDRSVISSTATAMEYNYREKVLLVDVRGLSETEYIHIRNRLGNVIKPKGIIFIENWLSRDDFFKIPRINKFFKDTFVAIVSSNKGNELMKMSNSKIALNVTAEKYENAKGINVLGCIKGKNDAIENDVVIISGSYDYLGNDEKKDYPGATASGGPAIVLETARIISENGIIPNKTIVFALWDGTYTDSRGSRSFSDEYLNDLNGRYLCIDLKNLIGINAKKVIVDTTNILPKDTASQNSIKAIKRSARKNKIDLLFGKIYSTISEDFNTGNQSVVIIDSYEHNGKAMTPSDSIEYMDKKRFEDVGQMVVDSIIEIAIGGM
ncbi:MAG: ABC transporter permease subunit [Bacillota bacterium]